MTKKWCDTTRNQVTPIVLRSLRNSLILNQDAWNDFLLIHNFLNFQTTINLTSYWKLILDKTHISCTISSGCSPINTYPLKWSGYLINIYFFHLLLILMRRIMNEAHWIPWLQVTQVGFLIGPKFIWSGRYWFGEHLIKNVGCNPKCMSSIWYR